MAAFNWSGWNKYTRAKMNNMLGLDDDLVTKVTALQTKVETIETNMGKLSDLTTTAKTTLVAAINEAATSGTST